MVKNKSNIGIVLVIVFILLSVFTVNTLTNDESLSVLSEAVYLPLFYTGECVPLAGIDNKVVSISSHTDAPTWYHCNSKESGTYIPPNEQCEYELYEADSFSTIYVCDGITTNKGDLDTNKCVKKSGLLSDNFKVNVNQGDSVYIDSVATYVFGDAKLRVKYPAYGIKWTSETGLVRPTTDSCIANRIVDRDMHTLDLENRQVIYPNIPLNVVVGQISVIGSSTVAKIDGVNNGDKIYITRPGYYYKFNKAEDGFEYVNTNKEYSSSEIECVPRVAGCSDDAKIIDLNEQNCDDFSGSINNYASVPGTNKLCKYICNSNTGTLEKTSDCITYDVCNSNEYFDSEDGSCRIATSDGEFKEYSTMFFIILGGIMFFVILLMLVIRKQIGGSNKGGTLKL